jgi:hypothetical protein
LFRFQLILWALLFSLAGVAQNSTIKLRINPSDNYRVRINDGEIHHTNQLLFFRERTK